MSTDGIEAVRLIIDNAQPVEPPASEAPPSQQPPPEDPPAEPGAQDWLPDDCPVTPLGVAGDVYFYLDALGQLRSLSPRDHSRNFIMSLFGTEVHLLYKHWPRQQAVKDSSGNVTEWRTVGWKPEKVGEALAQACAAKGVWNAFERVRGPGAWRGEDGELVLHCGNALYVGAGERGDWFAPGVLGRHVYPADDPRPRFAETRSRPGVAHELLETLKTWSWRRSEIDAQLMLGWIGAAILAGALDWRPLCWLTGGQGTGKSTLHKLIEGLLDGAIVSVSDASAAGVWQKLKHATLPVAIEELEAEEDNRRANAIVKLARLAASGGLVLRGGADHQGSEFVARSCFLFSSILVPPLLGQDRSRMAILELDKLGGGASPSLAPSKLREMGLQLRRRLVDGWPRYARTLEIYRAALTAQKHTARGADQFGTLLACAEILLTDEEPIGETVAHWAAQLAAPSLEEYADMSRDEEMCIEHVLTSIVDSYKSGARSTVAEWIRKAAGMDQDAVPAECNRVLGTHGLKVVFLAGVPYLAVANYHQGLTQLFQGTHWAGRSGSMGVWVQAIRRCDGADRAPVPVYFAGAQDTKRATIIPLSKLPLEPNTQGSLPALAPTLVGET